MPARLVPSIVCASILALAACRPATPPTATAQDVAEGSTPSQPEAETNPLVAKWTGPYGGVPAFDRMRLAALEPALDTAIEEHLAELDAIANNPEAPTFENTIVAYERSGDTMDRVDAYYGIWRGNLSTPELRELEPRIEAKLAAYETARVQNRKLFERIAAVYESEALAKRPATEQRLVKLIYDRFARQGATLDGAARERYAKIEAELAELHTAFRNNVLADEEGYVVFLTEEQTAGLPESFKAAAAAEAADRGREGEYAITNTRSSMDPFLTYSDDRGLREKVWRNYYSRGDNGDEHDNNRIIAEILRLRDERVALLGYDDYASWRLENRMAKTSQRAMGLMEEVWPAAVARAKQEIADMQAVARKTDRSISIEPWDYRYYANKVRKQRYDLDAEEVKQYMQLDKLREAMFMVAGRLFGFAFEPVPEGTVPVFHPDVRVWEVTDSETGEHIGLWYLDPFARSGKRSGAWATSYRGHSTFDGDKTVLASNNSNFIKGPAGAPVLVSWDDAQTFFHEFGHALHALSSNVAYPTLNSGVRDYTEFQSQLLERWLLTDEVVKNYLVHHETGEPIPPELVAKLHEAANFNQGFATTEYLASALVDMKFHTTDPEGIDPDAFERETLEALGMPQQIVMRHRSPHFGHIFSGEGYAAGYYGYLWAEVLTSDAAEAFAEAPGGFYDEQLASKLVEHLFAPRNSVDPAQAYRAFRGRDATVDALMRDRGFAKPRTRQKRRKR